MEMIEKANALFEIIKDYQADYQQKKFEITPEHIMLWAEQFGVDGEFVIEELLHIFPEVYLSKDKAKELLKKRIIDIQKYFGFSSIKEMISKCYFFNLQPEFKSQGEILILGKSVLNNEWSINYDDFLKEKKTHYIYFDDLLATGGTLFRDLSLWLSKTEDDQKEENYKLVLNDSKKLIISLFCHHTFGHSNVEWRFMKQFDDKIKKKIVFGSDYGIENHIKTKWIAEKQRLNCIYPVDQQSLNTLEYLAGLDAENDSIPAFRPSNLPIKETFFSSPENRLKLEKIFLEKGIELIEKIQSETPDKRKRPLGDTVSSHKTFGTGTLFFTWRNISNTCPLVFWWDVPGHKWTPLFFVKNRGRF